MSNQQHIVPFACRFCRASVQFRLIDLGMAPWCESYLSTSQLYETEPFYPIDAYVCDSCFLVQLQEYVPRSVIFREHAYFSSYSDSWVQHAKHYAATIAERMRLGAHSVIVEVGSNDGYLLQHFRAQGMVVLGVEPAANVAQVAIGKGVPTVMEFFGKATARELAAAGKCADLLVANNVLDLIPDLNDFMEGIKVLLKPRGVITMEFPYLMKLVQDNQFDTIYHEHVSYFSFLTVEQLFAAHGMTLFDVEELFTHGGSLRIYGRHDDDSSKPVLPRVTALKEREVAAGFSKIESYGHFQRRAQETKRNLLGCLIDLKRQGKSVAGYGAPAKGNALLNYCGIRTDFLDYTVDRNPYKQGKFTPGTHIPIYGPEKIRETRPDYLLILPWNLKEEIMMEMEHIREWSGRFIIPIPDVQIS